LDREFGALLEEEAASFGHHLFEVGEEVLVLFDDFVLVWFGSGLQTLLLLELLELQDGFGLGRDLFGPPPDQEGPIIRDREDTFVVGGEEGLDDRLFVACEGDWEEVGQLVERHELQSEVISTPSQKEPGIIGPLHSSDWLRMQIVILLV